MTVKSAAGTNKKGFARTILSFVHELVAYSADVYTGVIDDDDND